MPLLRRLPLLFLLLAAVARGQTDEDLFEPTRLQNMFGTRARAASIDPKRIINDSSSFLKEREPEMSAEEYALYEKVVTMLGTNPAFALRLLEAMINEKEPPSPAFRFILGNAYYAAGQNDKCESNYRAAVEQYPSFLRAWNNLGVLYYSTDRFAEAVKCFSRSVALGDRDPTTYGLLGFSLEKEENFISAEVAYMQALAGDPANGDWQEGLLRICIQGRQLVRAESVVRNLIKARPTEGRFWLVYANILLTDRRKLEAITVLETAAGAGVAGPDELLLLGDLYAEQRLHPEALAIYEKLLQPAPDRGGERLLRYARTLLGVGRPAEAEAALALLRGTKEPALQADLQLVRGELFAARKQWPESRREYEVLLATAPLHGAALLGVGRAYAAEDNLARATFAFEAAYRVPETTYRACLELANIALKNREYGKSVEYLQRALSIEKSDAVADYLARVRALVGKEG